MKYVSSGDRDSWPRKVARKYRRIPEAVAALLEAGIDETNQKYAITEFVEERIRMAKGMK